MIPVAHKEGLVIQEFEDELIISDGSMNAAHCLTPIAARIWECCDGYNTIDDIANLIEGDLDIPLAKDVDMRGLIWITVEELQRYGLIKEYLSQPISDANLSRRKMLKRLSIAGGFVAGAMFPLVRSMVVPEPAVAGCSISQKCELYTFICTCIDKGGVVRDRTFRCIKPNADCICKGKNKGIPSIKNCI